METFKRSKPYEPWREGEQLRLFCCGRLNEGKGHQDLVETIKLLLDEGIDARLDLAGEDDHGGTGFRKTLEKLIADRGVGQNVSLLGATASETVRDYLERAHVFTLATRHEALGVATMEAMAMEVPVVVCDVGGVGELVANEEVGLLVEPRNPAAMAKAVNRLMHDPELARRLGDGGRKAIADRFHSGLSANAIYQELCGTD